MYGLKITLAREVSITALRPDFWVVRIGSIPIGNYLLIAFIAFY